MLAVLDTVLLLKTLAVVFGATVILTMAVRALAARVDLLDHPDHRRSHARPTPRGGGVAVFAATMTGCGLLDVNIAPSQAMGGLAAAASVAMMAAVGFYDDVRPTTALRKLVLQTSAMIPLLVAWPASWPALAIVAAIVWMVGCANVVNFMDGSDGLVAGTVLLNLLCLAALAGRSPAAIDGVPALLVLAAALGGFLVFNYHPASIFMGDAGSLFVGCALGAMTVRLVEAGISPIPVALAITPLFADAGMTLLRRIVRGERFWEAHRSHFYQRLITCGWSHASVAQLYYAWAAIAGVLALAFEPAPPAARVLIVAVAGAVSAAVIAFVISLGRRPKPQPTLL